MNLNRSKISAARLKSIAEKYGIEEPEFIWKAYKSDVEEVKDGERVVVSKISSLALDRDNEVVLPEGIVLDDYNRTVLWCHDYSPGDVPHAKNLWIKPNTQRKPTYLKAATEYTPPDINEFGDRVYRYLTEWKGPMGKSIGFMPLEWYDDGDGEKWNSIIEDWKERYSRSHDIPMVKIRDPRRVYTKWALLEYSDVPVPANQDAIQEMKTKGLLTDEQMEEYLEFGNDTEAKSATPHVTLPLMPEDAAWNPGGVPDSQIIEAILGRDPADGDWTAQMNANYKKVNCWWDGTGGKISAFKLKIGRRDPITDKSAPLKYNWRQTANRMAILMGGRGGVDIPDADRKPVYNRLVKVYRMFDKEPPDFKDYGETLDIILFAMKHPGAIPVDWEMMLELEPSLKSWKDTVQAYFQKPDNFDLEDIIAESADEIDLDPEQVKDMVQEAIQDIFTSSGASDDDKSPDDEFNLDELPTPEELVQLAKGKVL